MSRATPSPLFSGVDAPGSHDPANPPRFRVLILYENLNGARQAMDRLARAIRQCARSTILHPMLWRFDQLDDARWRELSLLDAAEADCLVCAASTSVAFSAGASAWLFEAVWRRSEPATHVLTLSEDEEPWTIAIERRVGQRGGVTRDQIDHRDLRRSA